MALSSGTRLGPYEIVAPLGAGGMGEVYRARDTRLDRAVVIKILPEALSRDPRRRLRFDREARAISSLDVHPHICALYDVGDTPASPGPSAIISSILRLDLPPISTIQLQSPPDLDRVVRRCLAKSPGERWQTARDLHGGGSWSALLPGSVSFAACGCGMTSGPTSTIDASSISAATFRRPRPRCTPRHL